MNVTHTSRDIIIIKQCTECCLVTIRIGQLPIFANRTDICNCCARTVARTRKEYGARGFHPIPLGHDVDVGGEIFDIGLECYPTWTGYS